MDIALSSHTASPRITQYPRRSRATNYTVGPPSHARTKGVDDVKYIYIYVIHIYRSEDSGGPVSRIYRREYKERAPSGIISATHSPLSRVSLAACMTFLLLRPSPASDIDGPSAPSALGALSAAAASELPLLSRSAAARLIGFAADPSPPGIVSRR